jgi:hypothetical protein
MQVLAVAGIIATFALACAAIFVAGRALQRRGRDLTFVDPRYPDSMQAVPGNLDITPPGRPHRGDDTSLFRDDDGDDPSG